MGWSEIVIYCWLENYLQDSISIELQINGFDHNSKQTIYRTSFATMNTTHAVAIQQESVRHLREVKKPLEPADGF